MGRFVFLLLFLMPFLQGCEGDVYIDSKPELVVEGYIAEGDFPTVLLMETVPLNDEYQNLDSLGRYLIKWARVVVSDGEDSVVLASMYDKRFFPPYRYTSFDMRGKAGRTYTIKVDYKNFHASAVTTIPKSVPIDSVTFDRCTGSDSLYEAKVCFTDNPYEHNYYLVFTNTNPEGGQYLLSYMGYVDDASMTDSVAKIQAYRGQKLDAYKNYTPYFKSGEEVAFRLATVNQETYRFWSEVQNSVSFSSNMFVPVTTNVHSNIVGGIGYWQGYGISTVWVDFP